MRTTREFADQAEFDAWHESAKAELGLPRVAVNAATGQPDPAAQATTDWTELVTERAVTDEDGTVLELLPVTPHAVTADATHLDDVATLVRADLLTPAELTAMAEAFPAWEAGESVEVDDLRSHDGKLYRCVQAHTTQEGWEPSNVPALWVDAAPAGVIPEWVQPTGAHDAYNAGDRVTFEGSVYESLIDANVWSPTAHPAGWQLIE